MSGAVNGTEQYDGSPLELTTTLPGNGEEQIVTAVVAETGCTTEMTFTLPICEVCEIDAGTMPEDEFLLCHDELVQVQNLGDEILDGYELSYGLMNEQGEFVAWSEKWDV